MGFIWEGFGTVLGLFWALLGDFCSYFGRSKYSFFQAWLQDGLQKAFWVDFGSIWGRFGEDFGRVWVDLGSILGGFSVSWRFRDGRLEISVSSLAHTVCLLLHHILQQNPRAASLRLAERHNFFQNLSTSKKRGTSKNELRRLTNVCGCGVHEDCLVV